RGASRVGGACPGVAPPNRMPAWRREFVSSWLTKAHPASRQRITARPVTGTTSPPSAVGTRSTWPPPPPPCGGRSRLAVDCDPRGGGRAAMSATAPGAGEAPQEVPAAAALAVVDRHRGAAPLDPRAPEPREPP